MSGRLAFTPTRKSREYLDQLIQRMTEERGVAAHVTLRDAFDRLVEYARRGERDGPPVFNIEGTRMGDRFMQHLLGKKVAK